MTQRMSIAKLGLLALPMLAVACASDEPRPNDLPAVAELNGTADVDTCMQAGECQTCPSGNCVVHSWLEAGQPLAPADTHLCVLSGVHGPFGGIVQQIDSDYGTYWAFDKDPRTQSVVATCVPYSNFSTDQDGVVWLSPTFTASARDELNGTDMWWGDAASFLEWIGGFESLDGQDGAIIAEGGAWSSSRLNARSSGPFDHLQVAAHSLFVGTPHSGDLPRMFSFGGTTEFEAIAKRDQRRTMDLAQVDEALCYLTAVQGDLQGDSDGKQWVAVIPKEGLDGIWRWSFDVHNKTGKEISGSARCIYYDQCKHPENGCI